MTIPIVNTLLELPSVLLSIVAGVVPPLLPPLLPPLELPPEPPLEPLLEPPFISFCNHSFGRKNIPPLALELELLGP